MYLCIYIYICFLSMCLYPCLLEGKVPGTHHESAMKVSWNCLGSHVRGRHESDRQVAWKWHEIVMKVTWIWHTTELWQFWSFRESDVKVMWKCHESAWECLNTSLMFLHSVFHWWFFRLIKNFASFFNQNIGLQETPRPPTQTNN